MSDRSVTFVFSFKPHRVLGVGLALQFATAAMQAVRPLGIELRAGVNTGECERRGDDLAGQAVYLAARLCAEALPGKVYVSGTVTDRFAGGSIQFAREGRRTLKGINRPIETFSIAGPGSAKLTKVDESSSRVLAGPGHYCPLAWRAWAGRPRRRRRSW